MFKELEPHLDKVNLIISISKKGDRLTVGIEPRSKENKDLGITPLVVSGSAEEMDSQLPALVDQAFNQQTTGLIANIAEFADSVKKKDDANKKTTTTTITKTTTPATKVEPAKPVFDPAKLNKTEKKVWDKIEGYIESSKNRTDIDRINFSRKEAIKLADDIKSNSKPAIDEINKEFDAIIKEAEEKAKAAPPADGLFAAPVAVETNPKEAEVLVEEAQKDAPVTEVSETVLEPAAPKARVEVDENADPFSGSVNVTDDEEEDEKEEENADDTGNENDSAEADDIDIF